VEVPPAKAGHNGQQKNDQQDFLQRGNV
jgi:hypothetical protein